MKFLYAYKLWFSISAILVAGSIGFLAVGGLKLGIDFTGGSLLEISFTDGAPDSSEVTAALAEMELGEIQIQQSGGTSVFLRMKDIDNDTRQSVLDVLGAKFGEMREDRFESIGPIIGKELREKALIAIALVLVAIVLYVSWAFRQVSQGPVPSWVYGFSAILALVHDILITTGVFAALGYFYNVEVGTLFVTALLTILGFSVHDTIVVFDRIREMLHKHSNEAFSTIIRRSIEGTIIRSLNTSLTTLLVLLALYLFGGASIQFFVLALMIGVVLGTYSSIFIAPPLLIFWQKLRG